MLEAIAFMFSLKMVVLIYSCSWMSIVGIVSRSLSSSGNLTFNGKSNFLLENELEALAHFLKVVIDLQLVQNPDDACKVLDLVFYRLVEG